MTWKKWPSRKEKVTHFPRHVVDVLMRASSRMRAHQKLELPALLTRWTLPIGALRWPHAVENSLEFCGILLERGRAQSSCISCIVFSVPVNSNILKEIRSSGIFGKIATEKISIAFFHWLYFGFARWRRIAPTNTLLTDRCNAWPPWIWCFEFWASYSEILAPPLDTRYVWKHAPFNLSYDWWDFQYFMAQLRTSLSLRDG